MSLRITKFIALCLCLIVLAAAAAGCGQATQTKTNLTASEVRILANKKLNKAEHLEMVSEDERWNLSYQVLSVRKPTAEDLSDNNVLSADDWLLDVKVTMVHEYFQSSLWVTPPLDPVSYRLEHYLYSEAGNSLQELE